MWREPEGSKRSLPGTWHLPVALLPADSLEGAMAGAPAGLLGSAPCVPHSEPRLSVRMLLVAGTQLTLGLGVGGSHWLQKALVWERGQGPSSTTEVSSKGQSPPV